MSKLLVITYPENSVGFKLAGVDVIELEKGAEIVHLMEELMNKGEYGLIAIEEDFAIHMPVGLEKRIHKKGTPVLVSIRSPKQWVKEEEAVSPIVRLIRRAIGYQIKIKR